MTIETLPGCHDSENVEALNFEWASPGGCFRFIVDCKPLANIINGHCILKGDESVRDRSYSQES